MDLRSHKYWVFDLDGTLTEPAHDFEAIRTMLGLAGGTDILVALNALEPAARAPLLEKLDVFEHQLASRAVAAPGARETVAMLQQRGVGLGLVTRNNLRNVHTTLEVIGLGGVFDDDAIVTREDDLRPKPEPDGILALFRHWNAEPSSGVMVGNHVVDLLAGRSAGTATVHVDLTGTFAWPEHADLLIRSLCELL